jgi:hypothetical protein
MTGIACPMAAMAVSPWILPLIAIAAKRETKRVHDADRGRLRRLLRSNKADESTENSRPNEDVMHERLKARVQAMIWPD